MTNITTNFRKRKIELHRKHIAKNAKEALKQFHAGNFIPMSAESAIEHLELHIGKK